MAQLARDQGLQQARSIAQSLVKTQAQNTDSSQQRTSTKADISAEANLTAGSKATTADDSVEIEGSSAGLDASALSASSTFFRDANSEGRDWNRIGSELRREFLQEEANELPEHYRDAVEEYFRQLSKWKSRTPGAVDESR